MADTEKETKDSPNRLGILIAGFKSRLATTDRDKGASSSVFGLGSKSHHLSQEQEKLETEIQKALEELTTLKNQWPGRLEKIEPPAKIPVTDKPSASPPAHVAIVTPENPALTNTALQDSLFPVIPRAVNRLPKKGLWQKIKSILS